MRRTILIMVAASLVLVTVPTASAQSAEVAVCSAYGYEDGQDEDDDGRSDDVEEDDRGEDRIGVGAGYTGVTVSGPDLEETQEGADALARDVGDGDAESDDDGANWDVGPDPIDGNGFVHASLLVDGDEAAGGGTDDLDDGPGGWDTSC